MEGALRRPGRRGGRLRLALGAVAWFPQGGAADAVHPLAAKRVIDGDADPAGCGIGAADAGARSVHVP